MSALPDLLAEYERRREQAAAIGATAPVAKLYERVISELAAVDGVPDTARLMDTAEAAHVLGREAVTVARMCGRGEFEGAHKTSGATGEWRIPAKSVYAKLRPERKRTLKLVEY